MRLPRVRFTVRRMMVAVAVVAVCVTIAVPYLSDLSQRYEAKANGHWLSRSACEAEGKSRLAAYYESLADKYHRAARWPFLPVAPDPPLPNPE